MITPDTHLPVRSACLYIDATRDSVIADHVKLITNKQRRRSQRHAPVNRPGNVRLCNIAAANEELRTRLAAHEPSLGFLSAALASPHGAVRVASLWALYNLTWKHPARSALVAEKGFAARLAILRADPVLDVRERASSITWL